MSDGSARHHELSLRHPSGRAILAGTFGARDFKRVIFYSHGFPASRVEATIAHGLALRMGLTIVALDRPGFGGSEWYAERKLDDWAGDVALVADHLGVGRFGILGVSGGTPTAIAAAGALGERVAALSIVSGVSPMDVPGALDGMNFANRALIWAGRRSPTFGRVSIGAISALWRAVPATVGVWFHALLPKPDIEIVSRPEVAVILARNMHEALRQGTRGAVTEFMLLISDWSPLLGRVRVPTSIWHGDRDTYVPIGMASILSKGIAGSTFHSVEGGGHFMIVDRLEPILAGFSSL